MHSTTYVHLLTQILDVIHRFTIYRRIFWYSGASDILAHSCVYML